MPKRSRDLHGSAPDRHADALLVVDMINDLEFPGAESLISGTRRVARRLGPLVGRARAAGVPVIYVNDNFGRWRSDFRAQVRHCLRPACPAADIVAALTPAAEDYFVLKPKHSGFYATPLALLLEHLGTRRIVLTGMTVEACVYFTASDAYLRDFEIVLVDDCVVSRSPAQKRAATALMRQTLGVRTVAAAKLRFRP